MIESSLKRAARDPPSGADGWPLKEGVLLWGYALGIDSVAFAAVVAPLLRRASSIR